MTYLLRMEMEDAIARAIREICEAKNLNAMNIHHSDRYIHWNSDLGILGRVHFKVPFAEFQRQLESGMRSVSILVAFADLITKDSNKGMIEHIYEAKRRGSRYYFRMNDSSVNVMNMFIPIASRSWGYTSLPIHFTESEDGEYEWKIPDTAELYASVFDDQDPHPLETMNPEELSRAVSNYTGLAQATSVGVPVLHATQSARDYSEALNSSYISENEDVITREHGLTGAYPEEMHRLQNTDSEYIG